jgi:DnaJ family protein B protein 13
MLDDRTLQVPIADIMTPGSTVSVPGEGMPKPGGGKGNLILEVDLLFPTHQSEMQKMLLQSAFFLPPVLNDEQKAAIRTYQAAFTHELKGWATRKSTGTGGAPQ